MLYLLHRYQIFNMLGTMNEENCFINKKNIFDISLDWKIMDLYVNFVWDMLNNAKTFERQFGRHFFIIKFNNEIISKLFKN